MVVDTGSPKTGGWGSTWVELERPKPPKVDDHYRYWGDPPPELSPRCLYWVRQIRRGWRPSRRITMHDYDGKSVWYGVYIWEYINVIQPLLDTVYRINGSRTWRP